MAHRVDLQAALYNGHARHHVARQVEVANLHVQRAAKTGGAYVCRFWVQMSTRAERM